MESVFEADPTGEILVSIFQKHSPLHDGAVLINNGKITMAAAFLPLTSQDGLNKKLGTRHRSAIGITERCDAWALVVSEESGQVSLVREGVLDPMKSSESLTEKLKDASNSRSIGYDWWTSNFQALFLEQMADKIGDIDDCQRCLVLFCRAAEC